jgi:hypothetical protein
MTPNHRPGLYLLAVASTLLLAGCKLERVTSAISGVDGATQTATASLSQYYSSLNDLFSLIYWKELTVHPELNATMAEPALKPPMPPAAQPAEAQVQPDNNTVEVVVTLTADPSRQPVRSALYGKYRPEVLKTQQLGLQMLAAYTKALNALATSDAPGQAVKNMDQLVATANKLDTDVKKIDKAAPTIAGPVTQIAAILGKWALRHYQYSAIRDSIEQCNSPVNDLILGLSAFTSGAENEMRTRSQSVLANYVTTYNDQFPTSASPTAGNAFLGSQLLSPPDQHKKLTAQADSMSDSKRKDMVAEIQKLQVLRDRTAMFHASKLFVAMSAAQRDLYQYMMAKHKDEPSDWANLNRDVSTYLQEANYTKSCVDGLGAVLK